MILVLPDVVIETNSKQDMDDLIAYCAELSKLPCYSGDEIPPDPFKDTDDPEEDQPAEEEITKAEEMILLKIISKYDITKDDYGTVVSS
jgi:hypothetical protein